jgi:hypothetical protein
LTPFRPWLCLNEHRLEIEQVTEDGLCIFCHTSASVSTSPEDVDEAIEEDKHRRVRREKIDGKWQKILRKECSLCHILYDTPYPHSRYHSDKCRDEASNMQRIARKGGAVYCLFCTKFIPTKDKRRKFCNPTCRNDLRRKGPLSLLSD